MFDLRIEELRHHFGVIVLEDWRPIDGSPGYFVTNEGSVYSTLLHHGSNPAIPYGKKPELLVSFVLKESGYPAVNLHVSGKQTTCQIHVLVATAFHGPKPAGYVCCHNNGNRQDNRSSNLRWDTRSGNESDKILHGTKLQGKTHPRSKLTELQVREIRIAPGKQRDIAARFGISQAQVWNIKKGKQWQHLDQEVANV